MIIYFTLIIIWMPLPFYGHSIQKNTISGIIGETKHSLRTHLATAKHKYILIIRNYVHIYFIIWSNVTTHNMSDTGNVAVIGIWTWLLQFSSKCLPQWAHGFAWGYVTNFRGLYTARGVGILQCSCKTGDYDKHDTNDTMAVIRIWTWHLQFINPMLYQQNHNVSDGEKRHTHQYGPG